MAVRLLNVLVVHSKHLTKTQEYVVMSLVKTVLDMMKISALYVYIYII
jgi:hypothetical protein